VLPCGSADGGSLAPACPQMRAELTGECRRISAASEELKQSRRLLEAVVNGDQGAPRIVGAREGLQVSSGLR
jgi:hypothetical protein